MTNRGHAPTTGQRLGFEQLERLAVEHDELWLVGGYEGGDNGDLTRRIQISTGSFHPAAGGLPVRPVEEFRITLGPLYPLHPPRASVGHIRWLGFPHVLQGERLCLFMDPDREWDPRGGMAAGVQRLWDWLDDAVAGRFQAGQALYHGLGDVIVADRCAPFLVVDHIPEPLRPGIRRIVVREGSNHHDVVAWDRAPGPDEHHGLAITSAVPYRLGPGTTLPAVVGRTAEPAYAGWSHGSAGYPTRDMLLERLDRLRGALDADEHAYIMVAGPNLAVCGNARYDLACARVMRAELDAALVGAPSSQRLTYLHVDDVRPEITRRRDEGRPMNWFTDKTCEVWGCGALGSWIAEILVRAGAFRVVLRDPGRVSTGLLVRQDFTEADVGDNKAVALANRLRALSGNAQIDVGAHILVAAGGDVADECDLIIDATVNASVAVALGELRLGPGVHPVIAQVATDNTSATLGLLTVTSCGGRSVLDIDASTRDAVFADGCLEDFRVLWDAAPGDDIVPARGCSTPTFRGSAADAMGVASSAMSLLGGAADARPEGTFLFRLPHSSSSAPPLTWLDGRAAP